MGQNIPRDRKYIITLRHQPRQSQLRRRYALGGRNPIQILHQGQILVVVLLVEAGHVAGTIVWAFKVVRALDGSGHEASNEGAIGYDGHAELSARVEEIDFRIFDVQSEGTVFDLDGGDGVSGVCATEGCRRDFREA